MAITIDQATLSPNAGSTGAGSAGSPQQNHTFTTANAVAAGAMIVILVHRFHSPITGTITGTGGGLTWTTVHLSESGNIGIYLVCAFAPSGLASGTASVGVNCSVNSNDYTMTSASYLGVDTSGTVLNAVRAINAGSGATTWSTGSVAGSSGDALIGGSGGDGTLSTSSLTAGNERDDFNSATSSGSITLADKLSVSGSDSLGGTWNNALTNVAVAAAFIPAGGAGPSPTPFVPHRMPLGV